MPISLTSIINLLKIDSMNVIINQNPKALGKAAAAKTAELIRESINKKGYANIILATGASQFETLNHLIKEDGIDWSKVTMFHLDEYISLPETHKASFRKYLKERFLEKVPKLKQVNLINGEVDPAEECKRLSDLIEKNPIDVALVGIGENGHLAFNDPPADFENRQPFFIVDLNTQCRQQQVNEGWFNKVEDVPKQAITISISKIMQSEHIVCSVPDERKAKAVDDCLSGEINTMHPASILREHESCYIYLDENSSKYLLREDTSLI